MPAIAALKRFAPASHCLVIHSQMFLHLPNLHSGIVKPCHHQLEIEILPVPGNLLQEFKSEINMNQIIPA